MSHITNLNKETFDCGSPTFLNKFTNGSYVGLNGHVGKQHLNDSYVNGYSKTKESTDRVNGNVAHTNYDSKEINGNGEQINGTKSQINGDIKHINGGGQKGSEFTPIAICGMACRLPGGIESPQELWEFILAGKDARCRVPQDRYNVSSYYSPTKKAGTTITEHGYFLDESVDLAGLDTSVIGMTRTEVERLDPQQRILLEVVHEAFDDAGEVGWKGSGIGVYAGSYGSDWYDVFNKETLKYGMYQASATHDFMLSERISYELDLRGPSLTIRTACSSSLVGLNEACVAIARGDCESSIVAGTNIIMAPGLTTAMSEQGVLSPDGSCKTFSANADGYGRGEAVIAIYVKSLDAAKRDGNPIQAVITGTAVNFDGKTPTLSMPSARAQEALIRRAYEVAGVNDVSKTGFFECHGTGTSVGDPIETQAVAAVFKGDPIHIGSIKPNVGHSEGASGLSSLMKVALALKHQVIPPNIKSLPLNPKIPFEEGGLLVPTKPTKWPSEKYERASINCFGVGGANSHAIIESARMWTQQNIPDESIVKTQHASESELLLFSASTPKSLREMIDKYKAFLNQTPADLKNLAYTLAARREHLAHRAFAIVTTDKFEVNDARGTRATGEDIAALVMVFTGQGAAWAQAGRELLLSNLTFSNSIDLLEKYLQDLGTTAPNWSLREELLKPAKTSRISDSEFSQTLCTAIQLALVDTLAEVGIRPTAVVGHSSGEIAAAYAAGGLTAAEAINVAYYRGVITKKQLKPGAMAAVGLGWEEVQEYLTPQVVAACDNSPNSTTLSGDAEAIETVVAHIKDTRPGIAVTLLKVDKAYHSHHMTAVGADYFEALDKCRVLGRPTTLPFYSSVTGDMLPSTENSHFGPQYWQSNLEKPVRFNKAVQSILNSPDLKNQIFFEIGPHSALAGPLRQILAYNSAKCPYVSSLIRRGNSTENLLQAIGKLYTYHMRIDFKTLYPAGECVVNLPRYAWDHSRRYWHESRVSKEWRHREFPQHDLLGARVAESGGDMPIWRNLLHLANVSWLYDHKINDAVVYPFSAYVAMAAEAVRQLTGLQDGASFRHITVTAALVLNEDVPTELITSLRHHRLTNSLNSEWWEFSISSYNGHVWTKHCSGEVLGESMVPECPQSKDIAQVLPDLPRRVDSHKWYERLKQKGLNYGAEFTTLERVRCDTREPHRATASMQNNRWGDESQYHLHPVILDSYFQLTSIAAHDGVAHAYRRLIAAGVDSLTLWRSSSDQLNLSTSVVLKDDEQLGCGCVLAGDKAGNGVVLQASGVCVALFEDQAETANDTARELITGRSEWVPDIDFKDIIDLIKPPVAEESAFSTLRELSQLAIAHGVKVTERIEAQIPHLAKFKAWLSENASFQLKELDAVTLTHRMNTLVRQLDQTQVAPVAAAIQTVSSNIELLMKGEMTELEMNSNGYLDDFRDYLREIKCLGYLQTLGLSKPSLKILQLDAHLGKETMRIIDSVTRSDGTILYSNYVFSDPSSGMVNAAKDRFKNVSNMEFAILDIAKALDDQEFEEKDFDVIIFSGIYTSVTKSQVFLRNACALLSPNGRLLVEIFNPDLSWTGFILGAQSDWWSHTQEEDRNNKSTPSTEHRQDFKTAGFAEVDEVKIKLDSDSVASTALIAKLGGSPMHTAKKVTLLSTGEKSEASSMIIQELEARSYEVRCCRLDEVPPPNQDILSILDLERPFWKGMDATKFKNFKNFLNSLDKNSGIVWITRSCNISCWDPTYAPIIGLARALRSEQSRDFATCETDNSSSLFGMKQVVDVFRKFQGREREGFLSCNYEYAIHRGQTLVNRIFPLIPYKERVSREDVKNSKLSIRRAGLLDTLHWEALSSVAPEADEVEVEVYATGLNFRDVLIAMGIIPRRKPNFGYEAAGVVCRIGPLVTKLRVGDRVVLMGSETFSTTVTGSETMFEKLPLNISFEDGAALPLVFATAIYSLIDIGRLQSDQTVLIHSGCGGVGQAAIQVARMIGSQIYTTVSSEAKAQYLMDTFNLRRDQILSSRNISFVDDIMRQTGGKGVDLALNSLSGELLHATWSCIAKWGTMVEIGKRDLLGGAKLDMRPFLDNRNYRCVDLDQMSREKPKMVQQLLQDTMEKIRNGYIKPIRLDKVYEASAALDAFRYMQQGKHIGKIVVQLRDATGQLQLGEILPAQNTSLHFREAASYLLIGGLGGLGRTVALWMAQHGAKNLVFLSRSAGKGKHDADLVSELSSIGCTVQLVRGDVTSIDDVSRTVSGVAAPLRGVVQMSMVLRDQMFEGMSFEDWDAVVQPKIQGTWNLHNATISASANLDFFAVFSSLSGIVGQVGQANYASANTFLDSFVQYRLGLNLPCSGIDLGAMESVGYLSENPELLKKMQGSGWNPVQEGEFLTALNTLLAPHSGQIDRKSAGSPLVQATRNSFLLGISPGIPLSSPNSPIRLRNDVRMAVYHNTKQSRATKSEGSDTNGLQVFLNSAKKEPGLLQSTDAVTLLSQEIGKKLFALLLRFEDTDDINIKMNTADLGLDSLVAVELCAWWKLNFGFEITVLDMLSMGTLEALGKRATDGLIARLNM